jgi:hypothetical protein
MHLAVRVAAILLLFATSEPNLQPKAVASGLATSCAAPERASRHEKNLAIEFVKRVENSPLYLELRVAGGMAHCRTDFESGSIRVEYRFHKGGWLRIKRDERIEYTDQEARFAHPVDSALELLKRAERADFGSQGCGIDWSNPHPRPSSGDIALDVAYYGEQCNCQAILREDSSERILGVALRSAC